MNPFEFVLAIIFLVFVFRIVAYRMGIPSGWDRRSIRQGRGAQDNTETLRLREEVQALQERIKVLERITVEKENSLAKEIESLRDR